MKKQPVSSKSGSINLMNKRLNEGGFILVLTAALFVLISLASYQVSDPSWSHTSKQGVHVSNSGGQVGAYLADLLYMFFGYLAYILPLGFSYVAWVLLRDNRAFRDIDKFVLVLRGVGLFFVLMGGCGLLCLRAGIANKYGLYHSGGLLGHLVGNSLNNWLNPVGAALFMIALLCAGITWLTGFSWVRLVEFTGFITLRAVRFVGWIMASVMGFLLIAIARIKNRARKPKPVAYNAYKRAPKMKVTVPEPVIVEQQAVMPKVQKTIASQSPKAKAVVGLPAASLLDKGVPGKPMGGYSHQELETLSREVEQHLLDFGIKADVVAVHPGPVITRFELQLAPGVKVSRLSALSVDLARSLSVKSVRVVEIIPGKTVVGIELPNQDRAVVNLLEVIASDVYQKSHSILGLALGVDIAGNPMVVDLGKMPHLLVAGTTGSGKSVGINAMILSLLFKATPEQVRLIMIDPKMLELSVYDGIPHLLTPVVTDMKDAASALRWCVGEMERRYKLMSALGVRNLAGFNSKVTDAKKKGEPLIDPLFKEPLGPDEQPPELQALPYIVVIIDELADMMMVVGKKVEQLIARIAQKARAAGIHLILATQRPSVDVLTGLIKSNIPTRISFQVSSKIDSRTILDQQGADQLLGHGDMLYLTPGAGAPLRVHGAFVSDTEVHRIADDWRARGTPDYYDAVTASGDSLDGDMDGDNENTETSDPLYDQAVEFVVQTRKASVSSVQRRFKIGYNRAARLVDEMERTGLVGPLDGGSRDVLVPISS